MQNTRLALFLLSMVCLPAMASEEPHLAIIGATVFDSTGSQPYQASVAIKDGVISDIVPGNTDIDARHKIDARGLSLLPGFYDLHVHFTPRGEPAHAPQIMSAYVAAGVTTVFNFHAAPESFEPLANWYGDLPGPNVRFVARMSTTGGHGGDWADENMTSRVNTPAAATNAVDSLTSNYRPDAIKAFADGWRYGTGIDNSSMDEPTLTALVAAAHAQNTPVLTHTVTADRLAIAGRAGVDVIAHSTLDRLLEPEEVKALRDGGGSYAGTLAVYDPDKPRSNIPPIYLQMLRTRFDIGLKNMKALHDGGVPIALGTDAGMPGTPHGKSTLREMALMAQAGLTPTEILIAATANSARAMGEFETRGTIEVGKRADLVLIDGEPWRDIAEVSNIKQTLVNGRTMFDSESPVEPITTHPAPTKLTQPMVADFERADGRTRRDAVLIGDYDMGKERSQQVFQVQSNGSESHVLSLNAMLAVKESPYVGVVLPLSRGSVQPYDVSHWQGLRLDIRGKAGAAEIHLNSTNGQHRVPIEVSSEWQAIETPFSKTALPSEALLQGLMSVGVRMQRTGGQKVWLELDNVSFY